MSYFTDRLIVSRRIATLLPAILLLVVAGTQMVLARTAGLSPWKGGGFGMFASVDGAPFRWIRIFVAGSNRSEEIALPSALDDEAYRVVTWPHRRAFDHFAGAVADQEHRKGHHVDAVRVEVWKANVSPSLDVVESLVNQRTVRERDRHGR